jgi:hypothetical protein
VVTYYNIRNSVLALVVISIYLIVMMFINSRLFENSYFYVRNIIETIIKSISEWNVELSSSKDMRDVKEYGDTQTDGEQTEGSLKNN